ncbi:Rad9-domain-containing protein [Xylariales sp. PMI_506]|nr:Rad9-domain-containing protein [Xylariales sp. PMI_506]
MVLLRFTLSEEGVSALRDALACLNKFSEEVSLEATKDKLVFTTLNSSKSTYASFAFATNRFFSRYQFDGVVQNRNKFFCKLYNRALLSLFRARSGDPLHEHEKDTTIERCDVAIEDEPGRKSRFIVKIVCRNGMTTKYRLPFEVSPPVHAKFHQEEATNSWAMSSRTLRQLMEHFGPGIEFLDIHTEDEQTVNFTCFTEKITQGDEVLKKPLHTSIAVERDEFEKFEVPEADLHIVISVKDFRAITQHAAPFGSEIVARYSTPSRPMQLSYDGDGIKCEYLLMTVGERGATGQRNKKARINAKAPRAQQLEASASRATSHAPTPLPTPLRQDPMPSLRPSLVRPSQRAPPPPFEDDSLFVPMDNDNQWEPVNLNEDEDEEENARLEWDASAQPNPSALNMRSVIAQQNAAVDDNETTMQTPSQLRPEGSLEPTQPLSQVRKFGMFGD